MVQTWGPVCNASTPKEGGGALLEEIISRKSGHVEITCIVAQTTQVNAAHDNVIS